jgi:hypothetical protein
MSVRWTIDRSRELVEIVLEDETTVDDAKRFFDAIETAGAIPYRKLFDATKALAKIDNRVMAAIGQRIAGYKNPGPIAIVLPAGGPIEGYAKLFLMAVNAESRARFFRTEPEARTWLDAYVAPRSDNPGASSA